MSIVTCPERVETYLANKHEGKRLPFSCTLVVRESFFGACAVSRIMT